MRLEVSLLVLALFVLLGGCHSGSSGDDAASVPGAASSVRPDQRLFVLTADGAPIRTLDANEPTSAGLSEALAYSDVGDLALDPHGNRFWLIHPSTDQVRVVDARSLETLALRTTGNNPSAVSVAGHAGYVFVTNRADDTVSVFQADPPFDEVVESPLATGASPIRVVTNETTVAVLDRDAETVTAFDATPPFAESVHSTFAVGSNPIDLAADGDLVFVVNESDGDLTVIDLAAGTSASALAGMTAPFAIRRHDRRDQLFILTRSGTVHVATSSSTPAEVADSPWSSGSPAFGLAVNGCLDRVWVSASLSLDAFRANAPFDAIDSTPAQLPGPLVAIEPTLLRTLIAPTGGNAERTRIDEGRLSIAHGSSGLVVLDDTDPRASYAERFLFRVPTPAAARDVEARKPYLFVSTGNNGIQVIDSEATPQPQIVRTVEGMGDTDELFTDLSDLLAETGATGFSVIDVRVPAQSAGLLAFDLPGSGTGFDYSPARRYAFSTIGTTTLQVVDLYTSLAPFVAEEVAIPAVARDVATVRGGHAAVAADVAGVITVNVSPITGSAIAGRLDFPEDVITTIQAAEELVFAGTSAGELHLVHLGTLDRPVHAGTLAPPGAPTDVRLAAGRLYLSCGSTGVLVYRLLP